MKTLFKSAVLLLVFMMLFSFTACSQSAEPPASEEPPANGGETPEEPAEEMPAVALVLNGPVSDMGWNASGYSGLVKIEENFGAEISYTESVAQSDMEDVLRNYAVAGFELIFAHGSQFQDAVINTSSQFPDTTFVIVNGNADGYDNIVCVQVADEEQGFLMGAFAALMTETGTVGVIGGAEIPPITNAVKGFQVGVEYIDSSVEVLSAMTGSFDDITAAKETALAFIDNGADYIAAIANQAGLGPLEATAEKGVYSIGANTDQFELAPTSVVTSVVKDVSMAYNFAYQTYIEGGFSQSIYRIGTKEGLIFFSPYHDFEDHVPQDVRDRMAEVIAELEAGNITIL